MSTDEAWQAKDLIEGFRQAFQETLLDALKGIGGDITSYAAELSHDYALCLLKGLGKDENAQRNLDHLRAQVLLIAAKRQIILNRELRQTLVDLTLMLVKFGLRATVSFCPSFL